MVEKNDPSITAQMLKNIDNLHKCSLFIREINNNNNNKGVAMLIIAILL